MKPVPTDHARANPQCCSHLRFANRCDGPTSFASRAGRPTKDSGTRVPVSLRPLARARANRFRRRSYPLVHAGRVGMTGPWTGLPSKPICPSAPGPGALPPVRRAGAGAPESPGDSPFAGSPQRGTSSLGAGCCSGRLACASLRVLFGAWRHLRGWRLASPATSTVRELVALRLIVLPGRLCNGLSLNTNANHSMTRMCKSPANGALRAEATSLSHLR